MAEAVGIIQVPTGSAELRDQWLQDYRLAAIDTGIVDEPPVEPGTDAYLIAEATSQLFLIALGNVAISADDINVLKATGESLDAIRESDGLPIVEPSGSTGKIKITVSGSTTIANQTVLKLPNGLRIRTVGTVINPADQQEIDVEAIDTGAATNLAGGESVQFVSAPTNVSKAAKVSNGFPLTGGTDAETDARKRERILNTRRNKPAGGNWAYWRQFVLDRYAAIDDCYVYPALGGPSSQLIVPTRLFDRTNNDYSRVPTTALIQTIRGAVQTDANSGVETVVRGPADQSVDFTLLVDIPDSTLAGGNGQGWTDSAVWPTLEAGDSNRVRVSGSPNSDYTQITVTAQTATAPIAGQTQIAWWSPADRKFYSALVIAQSGSAGAWVLTLDRPLVGIDGVGVAANDYISPNAQNLSKYGDTWVSTFEKLGPGEMPDPNGIRPRNLRNPNASDERPHSITTTALTQLASKHPEITDISFGYSPTTTPTVPATVDDPPNILVPRHLGIYGI